MAKLYMNPDTGVTFTIEELKESFEQFKHEMSFDSFEEYLDEFKKVENIYTADRETGTFIDECESIEEAQNKIAEYEESDKADGTYEPDFYDIVYENHMTIY